MKFFLVILCSLIFTSRHTSAQSGKTIVNHSQGTTLKSITGYPNFDSSLVLESKTDTTANVSFGDLDGDGHLDIFLVKGRHWPIVDKILIGDGSGGIKKAYSPGDHADRSYTGAVVDFNGDGFLDIAVSNDAPDKKLIYFNDGKGVFTVGSEFGRPEWPTRNVAVADINKDGLPDLILANRGNTGTSNYICLNEGKGKFNSGGIAFAHYPASTITPVDLNKDGFVDLVVPHRDGGQSYIYPGNAELNFSDANRFPFGPNDAMIRSAAVADFNGDKIPDIVAIDERKGVILFFGQKDNTFSTGTFLPGAKSTPYALAIADLNNDGKMDIIVGNVKAPSVVFFSNDKAADFESISFGDANGTVYGFAIADFNEDGIPDIAAARSDATSILYFGRYKAGEKK